jgi:branched-chain amino acid transport system substrate-binding protein
LAITMQRRRLLGSLVQGAATASLLGARRALAAGGGAPIRIGYSLSATGSNAMGASISQAPNYALWRDQVNARGGLLIKGQGRRPIEFVSIDDRSDTEITVRHYEDLMVRQRVDLVLAPWGTRLSMAVAPVAEKHGYPLLAPTMITDAVSNMKLDRRFTYGVLSPGPTIATALVSALKATIAKGQVRRVGLAYVDDAFGTGLIGELLPRLEKGKPAPVAVEKYPLGARDLAAVVKKMAHKEVDAFVGISYPPDSLLFTSQARELRFNPAFYFTAVGTAFPNFRDGSHGAEGVLGIAGWNPKVKHPGAAEYFEAHKAMHGKEPDRYASAYVYASLQILETCVAEVGLDRRAIKGVLDAKQFQTIVGPLRFISGVNASTPGMIGQWQSSEFEIVWPTSHATAKLIIPKPAWA